MEDSRAGGWILRVAKPAPAGKLASAGFEEMYADAWPRLCRYSRVLVRNHEDAEDVASETIRRAYGAWQAGRGPAGDPIPWLFLIARRIVIDNNRRSPSARCPCRRSVISSPLPIRSVELRPRSGSIRYEIGCHLANTKRSC